MTVNTELVKELKKAEDLVQDLYGRHKDAKTHSAMYKALASTLWEGIQDLYAKVKEANVSLPDRYNSASRAMSILFFVAAETISKIGLKLSQDTDNEEETVLTANFS